jgi:hypothetical protein
MNRELSITFKDIELEKNSTGLSPTAPKYIIEKRQVGADNTIITCTKPANICTPTCRSKDQS